MRPMHRDMELVRRILLAYEGREQVDLDDVDDEVFQHHLRILHDAGFLKEFGEGDSERFLPQLIGSRSMAWKLRLTWAGNEFLDAARSQPVWKSAMARVAGVGGTVALPVLVELLTSEAKKRLGLTQ